MAEQVAGAFVNGHLKGISIRKWESADRETKGETKCLVVDTGDRDVWVSIPKDRETTIRDEYRDKQGSFCSVPVFARVLWLGNGGAAVEDI